ncbi:2-amino-4-hydroxy-6-hydroxymethyldihydropteridine diphosphokinase [Thermovirga sp.]|uniref:2-amino-4-hydroxy-6- hydroxymethyldihydropteridine diphosphokinase n=1 Tax=Thermovirga sp. TaxID=2699834 RepID=UPI0025E7E632|nr:2-amino-4-hydroxy-6-hydroxymethyldihydropteridine diphosphokinase [Thermovirga sp.]MBO8153457.1 2-amino-4-hydroxy-6-hydroxymethyldihydropteridine diphosphokinase [Thermovirga sp.]
MSLVAISMGSNLGNRLSSLRKAILLLKKEGFNIIKTSDVFETPPFGVTNQPRFLNACLLMDTEINPADLLEKLKKIENEVGRIQRFRWGPREIDLDIIFYDEKVIDGPSLKVPHPHMHERPFVLIPLKQISPQWVHPILKKTVEQMAEDLHECDILRITEL